MKEKLPPTDSRLRPDQRHLENGEYDKANAEKLRLETRQRMVYMSFFPLQYAFICNWKNCRRGERKSWIYNICIEECSSTHAPVGEHFRICIYIYIYNYIDVCVYYIHKYKSVVNQSYASLNKV